MDLTSYPRTPRLCNRFSLGTDPEFTFTDSKGNYVYAESLGLNTLQAFGCDMAGRQAELRTYPSKFALEVVASMVDTLRWMSYTYSLTIYTLTWSSVAYNGFDGCGGHIHFGRKRKDRNVDVHILDQTTLQLLSSGALDKQSQRNRIAKTKYGRYGDIRVQSHGYEYRTLPTAMANPWLTYFILVVNKLGVYEGTFPPLVPDAKEYFIKLLTKYRDIDDDAAIALKAIKIHGFPIDSCTDFKPHWGIPIPVKGVGIIPDRIFFPSVIQPEEETCLELFSYLTKRIPLPNRLPKPTWSPCVLPKEFSKVIIQAHTLGHLPDVGMNLITRNARVSVDLCEDPVISIRSGILLPVNKIKESLSTVVDIDQIKFYPGEGPSIHISVSKGFNNSLAQCKFLNKILSNTELFPICKAKNFHSTDWSKWDKNTVSPVVKPILGKVIAKVFGSKREEVISKKASQVELMKQAAALQYQMQVGQVQQWGNPIPAIQAPGPNVRRRRRP